ncbi:membrane alanine aminopeptidase N [Vibrio ponticus]|nr:membrane alanine aminopeptidase N [Vibrio ponticus]
MAQAPQAKYRKDYQSPSHTITDIDLTFKLHDSATIVTAVSQVKQLKSSSTLELDGDGLVLKSLLVNQESWTDYELVEDGIKINQLPEEFTLTIVTEINPEANTALEVYTNLMVLTALNVKRKVSVALLTTLIAQMY